MFYKEEFDKYINKLKNSEHFKYSRFNDGEIIAASGVDPNGANCDNHKYFPSMGQELDSILSNYTYSDDYILEHYRHWYDNNFLVNKYLNHKYQQNPNLKFVDDDFIRKTHENEPEKYVDLIESFRDKKVIIVGSEYLTELNKYFNFKYIQIPQRNCYLQKDYIINQIEILNKTYTNIIYLFSASMATNIIIDHFKEDKNNTYIDWGSVWDTFFVGDKYKFLRKRSSSNKDKYLNIYKDYLIK